MHTRTSLFTCSLLAFALTLGCSSSKKDATCSVGDRLACTCAGGGSGFRTCTTAGSYGACDCSATQPDGGQAEPAATPPVDAESEAACDVEATRAPDALVGISVDSAGSLLALYAPCTVDSDCESSFCYLYNDGRRQCTKTCTSSAECPAPSSGCNARGVCKNPM